MKITISTPLNPTENSGKILNALEKFFPMFQFKTSKAKISGQSDQFSSLKLLQDKIVRKHIKGTVKYLLLEYRFPGGSKLMLNKQALVAGKINFVEEKYPLGNVEISIETDNLESAVDYLTGA